MLLRFEVVMVSSKPWPPRGELYWREQNDTRLTFSFSWNLMLLRIVAVHSSARCVTVSRHFGEAGYPVCQTGCPYVFFPNLLIIRFLHISGAARHCI